MTAPEAAGFSGPFASPWHNIKKGSQVGAGVAQWTGLRALDLAWVGISGGDLAVVRGSPRLGSVLGLEPA